MGRNEGGYRGSVVTTGVVHQINVSPGGVPKRPVMTAHVGLLGLAGDDQSKKEIHGGPERAVCLFAMERIEAMAAEGHPIGAGRRFKGGDFNRMNQKIFPGWSRVYAKVVATGWVKRGDVVELWAAR